MVSFYAFIGNMIVLTCFGSLPCLQRYLERALSKAVNAFDRTELVTISSLDRLRRKALKVLLPVIDT